MIPRPKLEVAGTPKTLLPGPLKPALDNPTFFFQGLHYLPRSFQPAPQSPRLMLNSLLLGPFPGIFKLSDLPKTPVPLLTLIRTTSLFKKVFLIYCLLT